MTLPKQNEHDPTLISSTLCPPKIGVVEYLYHCSHVKKIEHMQIDHLQTDNLDNVDPYLPLRSVVQNLFEVQIQPGKHVLHHAGYTASSRKYELQMTQIRSRIDDTDQVTYK